MPVHTLNVAGMLATKDAKEPMALTAVDWSPKHALIAVAA